MNRLNTTLQPIHRLRGVTLVEVMVVVAIIAIIALVAAPSYNGAIDRQRLKAAAEAVLADIRWARSESIKRNVPVRISFTTGAAWNYTVIPDTNGDGTFGEAVIKTGSNSDFPSTTLSAATFSGNLFSTIDPVRGTASAGHVEITSAEGTTARVTLSTLGRSRICGFGGYEGC